MRHHSKRQCLRRPSTTAINAIPRWTCWSTVRRQAHCWPQRYLPGSRFEFRHTRSKKGLRWGLNDKIEKVEKTDDRNYRGTSVDLSSWLLVVTNLLQYGIIRGTNVGSGRPNFVDLLPPLSSLQWQGGWLAADCGETWRRQHCSSLHSKLHETSTSGNPWPLLQTSVATLLKVQGC